MDEKFWYWAILSISILIFALGVEIWVNIGDPYGIQAGGMIFIGGVMVLGYIHQGIIKLLKLFGPQNDLSQIGCEGK